MLAMSEASIQISSGSGFSRWGAYLGNMPRICFPGQRHCRVFGPLMAGELDREPEAMIADDLSEDFVRYLLQRLNLPTKDTSPQKKRNG
jgi:hypothetical protein